MDDTKRVLVIGAGIGGVATGVALKRTGIPFAIFERTSELREVGAGLSIQPVAMQALRRLDLEQAVIERSTAVEDLTFLSWQGEALATLPQGEMSRASGALSVNIHRADLHTILADALDQSDLHLSMECVGFEQDDGGVTAVFANGSRQRGSVLVGADGIRSVVRKQLLGADEPRYAGYIGWRGIAKIDHPMLQGGRAFQTLGGGGTFNAWPLPGGRCSWAGSKNVPQGAPEDSGGRKQEVLAKFKGWHEPITAIIEATPDSEILRNDIIDRPPSASWGEGRVTLLGDAAHATTPNMGQGAGLAIEDAVTLAMNLSLTHRLDYQDVIEACLRAYEKRRNPRTSGIVEESWRMGMAYQLEDPAATRGRNMGLKAVTPEEWRERIAESYRYQV